MNDLIQQGVNAFKAGDKETARKLLSQAIRQNPDSERAWGWMYNVCNTDQERTYCLKQVVRINPQNEKARLALDALSGSDFPNELPTQRPAAEQKTSSVQVEKNAVHQKAPAPNPYRNILIAIVVILFVCLIGSYFALTTATGGGNPTPTVLAVPRNLPFPIATDPIITAPGGNIGSDGSPCCKVCGANSQPCGDSCISLKYTCSKPPGCACK